MRLSMTDLLDRIWPSRPPSWRDVPARVAAPLTNVVRLTTASVIAYVLTVLLTEGPIDLTGALTALLVVQVSAVGTLRMGAVRVGAVLTGVGVALLVSVWVGLTWWSLALAISSALLLARTFRLGAQSLETAISAMLILGTGGQDIAAETRVVTTLIGAGVGVLFPFLFPPAVPVHSTIAAVRDVARQIAQVLDAASLGLLERPLTKDAVAEWIAGSGAVTTQIAQAAERLDDTRDLRRMNPRAIGTRDVVPELQSGLETLERCLLALRALFTVMTREAPEQPAADDGFRREVRAVFGVVLHELGATIDSYGQLLQAEARGDRAGIERTFGEQVENLRETRAVLTELMLVDPRERTELWLLRGSILSAVDQILQHLDLEARLRGHDAWEHPPEVGRETAPIPVVPLRTGAIPTVSAGTGAIPELDAEGNPAENPSSGPAADDSSSADRRP